MLKRVAPHRSSVKSAMLCSQLRRNMELVITSLAVLWAWVFIKGFLNPILHRVPDWVIHLTVIPGLAYLALHAPHQYVLVAAVAGVVLLLHGLVTQGVPSRPTVKRRRSNIPPPP